MPEQKGDNRYVQSSCVPRLAEPDKRPPVAPPPRSAARLDLAALLLAAAIFVGLAVQRPTDVFWSPDEGGKLLQVRALLGGSLRLDVPYPGRVFDPDLTLRPFLHSFTRDGEVRLPWPMSWILPNALLHLLLGPPGLLLLPVVGALLAIWSSAHLASRLAPGPGRLTSGSGRCVPGPGQLAPGVGWLAAALLGLTSPLLIYGAMPWEHAAAAGAFGLATVLLFEWALEQRDGAPRLLAAGLALGALCAWRPEGYFFSATLVAVAARARPARRLSLLWSIPGAAILLAPHWAWTWYATGQLLPNSGGFAPPGSPAAPAFADTLRGLVAAPIDLLAGASDVDPGTSSLLPVPLRWLALAGLLCALAATRLPRRRASWLSAAGVLAAGSPTVLLLLGPSPLAVHGLVAAAPVTAVALLAAARPQPAPWSAALRALSLASVAAVSLAVLLFHSLGLSGGELEWGPRFLLPAYVPLLVLAAAEISRQIASKELALASASLVVLSLGLLFQLSGLVQVRASERRLIAWAQLLRELPERPIIIRDAFLSESTAGLPDQIPMLCADAPAMLRFAADRLAATGAVDLWYVQFRRLPTRWLHQDLSRSLAPLESRAAEGLRADRFSISALSRALDDRAAEPFFSTSCPGRAETRPGRYGVFETLSVQ
ncbi:MAG: hypothetical protein IT307_03350 [Chloroflexi bacterium]|nr:hypothetical protein [Chloroflexota bacterium]